MVRIKDIAKEAQVSEGTVDRVIHNRGGVSKKTEEKVRAILKKRNFSINPIASALAMKNRYVVAVLIPEFTEEDSFWKSPYLGILKAKDEVETLGINVVCFKYNQYSSKSYTKAFDDLLKIKPKLVLFVPLFLKETSKITSTLQQLDITYMFLNVDVGDFKNVAYIGQDSYMSGFTAGKLMHLSTPAKAQFLVIKFRDRLSDNNAISRRIQGFKDYFKTHNLNNEFTTLYLENYIDRTNLKRKLSDVLTQQNEIKGLFVPSSKISIIVDGITQKRLKSLRLLGFDNTPQNIACLQNETITYLISQKPFDQGYEAIRLITDFLQKGHIPNNKVHMPIEILTKENVLYSERSQYLYENKI